MQPPPVARATDSLIVDDHDPGGDRLAGTVVTVLTTAARIADLTTLQLTASGRPRVATLVRRPGRPLPALVAWTTAVEPCAWHGGLRLVATAPSVDAGRRAAVSDAAALVGELLVAEGRREEAVSLADRAIEIAGQDSLTALGNRWTWRRSLDDETARAVRYKTPTSVVILDLDGLKDLNDTEGHAAGDAQLRRASDALREASRAVDVVCRLGGDEFGVLAPETGIDGANRLASRLRDALTERGVQASLGVATSEDGRLDEAWHDADLEMYAAKRLRAQDAR